MQFKARMLPSTMSPSLVLFFFLNDTATTEIYTLSLHDALPIYGAPAVDQVLSDRQEAERLRAAVLRLPEDLRDRKSTRLNSSHSQISYAVFCLKKKNHCSTYSC